MYEVCGEKELKVILALDPGDSISGVARKIDENRETIRRVVNRLEEAGYVVYDDGLQLVDQTIRDAGLEFLTAATDISPPSISEAYVLPQFAGMEYAFTAIDAVYVWTRGGYQVARDPEDYPLFIAVHKSELDAWTEFFDRFGIPTSEERQPTKDLDGTIQIVLEPRSQIDAQMVDGRSVIPPKKPWRSQMSTTQPSSRHSICLTDVRRRRHRRELPHGASLNMSQEDRSEALIEVLEELEQSDIGFVLVGGYAISQFETRFSTDLDLVIAPDDYDEVVAFLEAHGFERQADLEVPQKRPSIIGKSNSSSVLKGFLTRSE